MKNLQLHKVVILLFFVFTLFSCSKGDDDVVPTANLIGEWQRSDFNDEFEYKLIFESNNFGYRTERVGDLSGQPISYALSFNWDTDRDILTLDYDGEIVTTRFRIDADGRLYLLDINDLFFIQL